MVKVEHLNIKHNDHIIFEDISFTLAQNGFVSFCASDEAASLMAKLLSAERYPMNGDIWFQQTRLNKTSMMSGKLRSSFVQGLFHDFQLILNKSVLYNVTLDLSYPKQDVEKLLIAWGLDHKKYVAVEDLEFEDQAKIVIVRCLLRKCHMIVFDVYDSLFSPKERECLYQLLKKCSTQLLVVICGDQEANKYADHIIECEDGYLLSDSLCKQMQELSVPQRCFHLPKMKKKAVCKDINQRSIWKFRMLFLCLLISAMAINIVMFNSQLHLVELEESVLSSRGQNAIRIEKQAVGNDGRVYTTNYEALNQEDGKELESQLSANVIYSYEVENARQELNRIYGSLWDDMDLYSYQIIELNDLQQLGLSSIIGSFPKSYFETCISSYTARQLIINGYFPELNPQSSIEDVIGKRVKWYNRILKISGVLPVDENANLNIQIQQVDENGSKQTTMLYEGNLFVKTGFMEHHDVSKQLTFPNVIKQIKDPITSNTVYIDQLQYINEDAFSYYDGENFLYDSHLNKQEVYLDFYTVYELLYQNRYHDVLVNDDMTYEEKYADYYNHAATLVGKTMQIETYRISGAQSNSTLMNATVTIKGIKTDANALHIFDEGFDATLGKGSIYMNRQVLEPYLKQNYQVDKLLYQSNDRQQLIDTLDYLKEHPFYLAFVSNSRMFQAFVVDISALRNVLLFIGTGFGILYLIGFLYLMDRNRRSNLKEMTIYYLFGETRLRLEHLYVKNASMNLLRYSVFAGLASLSIIYVLIYFIYKDFMTIDIPIVSYIMIPIIYMLVTWLLYTIVVYGFVKLRNILDISHKVKKV